jgi:hypothetical protein
MTLPRSCYCYKEKETSSDNALESRIGDICLTFPGYEYRKLPNSFIAKGG